MGILSWIVMGLIVGALAKWIMPGPDPGGCIVTTLIGIAGAFVGGFLCGRLYRLSAGPWYRQRPQHRQHFTCHCWRALAALYLPAGG